MDPKKIHEDVLSIEHFKTILKQNQGIVLLKFGATWCKPCQNIHQQTKEWFDVLMNQYPNISIYQLDVDESFELYAFMKKHKMLKGIPALFMYVKGNKSHIMDDSVNSSDPKEIEEFFKRCCLVLEQLR